MRRLRGAYDWWVVVLLRWRSGVRWQRLRRNGICRPLCSSSSSSSSSAWSHDGAADDGPDQLDAADDGEVEADDAAQRLLALEQRHARPVQEAPAQRVLGLAWAALHWSQKMRFTTKI